MDRHNSKYKMAWTRKKKRKGDRNDTGLPRVLKFFNKWWIGKHQLTCGRVWCVWQMTLLRRTVMSGRKGTALLSPKGLTPVWCCQRGTTPTARLCTHSATSPEYRVEQYPCPLIPDNSGISTEMSPVVVPEESRMLLRKLKLKVISCVKTFSKNVSFLRLSLNCLECVFHKKFSISCYFLKHPYSLTLACPIQKSDSTWGRMVHDRIMFHQEIRKSMCCTVWYILLHSVWWNIYVVHVSYT